MKKNVGDVDRLARGLFGLAFLSLPIIVTLPLGLSYYALSVAAVLIGASLLWSAGKGHCFVYGFLGFSTCKT